MSYLPKDGIYEEDDKGEYDRHKGFRKQGQGLQEIKKIDHDTWDHTNKLDGYYWGVSIDNSRPVPFDDIRDMIDTAEGKVHKCLINPEGFERYVPGENTDKD